MISSRSVDLPITHELTLPYAASLLVALLIAVASGAALVTGSVAFYGVDATVATAVAPSTGGLLVPGFLAQDVCSLVVALPTLLGLMWAARRGSLIGLLLWIGSLVYVLYTYVHYLVGAPFNSMFLAYVALVSSAAFTSIALVASVDGERVRRRLGGAVPARLVGGILVGLGLLTLARTAVAASARSQAAWLSTQGRTRSGSGTSPSRFQRCSSAAFCCGCASRWGMS